MTTTESTPVERTVTSGDVDLHVLTAGEGPPVLLAHGFPELAYSWRHQIPALAARGYRVLAPDQECGAEPLVCETSRRANDLFLLAFGEHDPLRRPPQPLEHPLQHTRDRVAPAAQ